MKNQNPENKFKSDSLSKEQENEEGKVKTEESNFLLRLLSPNRGGRFAYNLLLIVPIPMLLWFLDYIVNSKIKHFMCYTHQTEVERATHVLLFQKEDGETEILKIKKRKLYIWGNKKREVLTITYKHQRFIYSESSGTFVSLHSKVIGGCLEQFVSTHRDGLMRKEIKTLRRTWGHNELNIEFESPMSIVLADMSHPLGLFEIFSYIVVALDIGPFTLTGILVVFFYMRSLVTTVRDELEIQAKIRKLADSNQSVIVIRENEDRTFTKQIVRGNQLLPGDLIEVIANMPIPADCVLVKGECVMQESMFTGESTPILKVPFRVDLADKMGEVNFDEVGEDPNNSSQQINSEHLGGSGITTFSNKKQSNKSIGIAEYEEDIIGPRNNLHSGSMVLFTKGSVDSNILAVVTSTGYSTRKGQMIQHMTNPDHQPFKFYNQAFELLVILFFIAFGTMCYYIYFKRYVEEGGIQFDMKNLIIHLSTLFMIVVKPSIPICLFEGLDASIRRLKKFNISTINRFSLPQAAWVGRVCFDKTGTLTQDTLIMKGFLSVKGRSPKLEDSSDVALTEGENAQVKALVGKESEYKNWLQENGMVASMFHLEKNSQQMLEELKSKNKITKIEALFFVRNCIITAIQRRRQNEYKQLMIRVKMAGKKARIASENNIDSKNDVCKFSELRQSFNKNLQDNENPLILICFGTCNNLIKIGNQMIGDPLEVEMFRHAPFTMRYLPSPPLDRQMLPGLTGGSLKKTMVPSSRAEQILGKRLYRSVRKYEFDNDTRRMTVINVSYIKRALIRKQVLGGRPYDLGDISDLAHFSVVCKGAPETVSMYCDLTTLPEDFEERNNRFSAKGYKVLGLSGKHIHINPKPESLLGRWFPDKTKHVIKNEKDLKELEEVLEERKILIDQTVFKFERDFFEKDMQFLGLYMMTNPLQKNATAVVQDLESNSIKTNIITGDNVFTALNVAKQVGMAHFDTRVYLAKPQATGEWKSNNWIRVDGLYDDVHEAHTQQNQTSEIQKSEDENPEESNDPNQKVKIRRTRTHNSLINRELKFSLADIRQELIKNVKVNLEKFREMKKEKKILNHQSQNEEDESEIELSIDRSSYDSDLTDYVEDEDPVNIFNKWGPNQELIQDQPQEDDNQNNNSDENENMEDNILKLREVLAHHEPCLVISGDSFDMLVSQALDLPKIDILMNYKVLQSYLKKHPIGEPVKNNLYFLARNCKIYGRCDKDQKVRIVNFVKYFRIDPKATIGFVGDGTNDLEAIKQAHFALKLGHTQLSTSTSFVSDDSHISALIQLINEAKCSLQNGYHNMGMMMFFIILQFIGIIILLLEDIQQNSVQFLFMDFALMNLFGLCLPEIEPHKKLRPQRPRTSLWHRELWFNIIANGAFALVLFLYCLDMVKAEDYYVPIKDIVIESDLTSGEFTPDNYKFFENHLFFVMTCVFALIYVGIDNRKDTFRKGFFNSQTRTWLFVGFLIFCVFMQIMPLFNVSESMFCSWLAYTLRIRVIFTNQSIFSQIVKLCTVFVVFFAGCLGIKMISQVFTKKRDQLNLHYERVNTRLLDKIDSANNK